MSERSSVPDRRDIDLSNWRQRPASLWSFQNVRELVPTAAIIERARVADDLPDAALLSDIVVEVEDGVERSALDHLVHEQADVFLGLRDGRPVTAWSAPHCNPANPHLVFSITKSVTALLAGIAAGRGLLDVDAPVHHYLPVPREGAYADATVRDLLDMTVALRFEEDYLDLDGDFDRYRRAMLWNPEREGKRQETLYDVVASLPRAERDHGVQFAYGSPNTDLLGMVVERAFGRRFAEIAANELFLPLGLDGPASITVDRAGHARAAGGLSITARDLARLGQMVLDNGKSGEGRQVVPPAWIGAMRAGGDRTAWKRGDFADLFEDGSYRSCWYASGDDRGSMAAIGIHGQWVWIDPASRVVLVMLSSRAEPSDDAANERNIAMLSAIARAL